MARIPIVAGNWKMNANAASARELAGGIRGANLDAVVGVEKVVCPPFVYLALVAEALNGTSIEVGAQNAHWEEKGAFTGEVSAAMLRDFCRYVIIGHSERRRDFLETDELVNRKLRAVLAAGLTPIVCVGETGEERQAGETHEVLRRQVHGALDGIDLPASAVVAYEPVWAIGTGVAATADDANEAIGFMRREIAARKGEDIATALRILYGGSVTPDNIAELVAQPEVDGGLVGGASLNAESFAEMVRRLG